MKNGRLKNPNRSQSCKCQVRSYIHKYKCLILKSSNITVGTSNLQYWGPVLTPLLNILLFLQQKVSNVSKTHLAWYLKESETVYINGILLTNLFWPTVRKIVLVIEKNFWNLRLKAEILRSLKQSIQTVKGQNCFWN